MYLIKKVYKLHCLLFYKLVRAVLRLDKIFDNELITFSMEWVMWRAFIAIFYIQGIWYFILLLTVEIVSRKTVPDFFEDKLISSLILLAVIYTFNYFTLIYKKRWFKYDEEFAGYSKTKNRIINIAIPIFYIFSAVLLVIVFMIRSNLGHAGKIEGF